MQLVNLYLQNAKYFLCLPSRLSCQEAFLPQGYPATVSKDYMGYQIWDTLQVTIF